MTAMMASAVRAILTASAIRCAFFTGSAGVTVSFPQLAGDSVMRVPSANATSIPVPALSLIPCSTLTPLPGSSL